MVSMIISVACTQVLRIISSNISRQHGAYGCNTMLRRKPHRQSRPDEPRRFLPRVPLRVIEINRGSYCYIRNLYFQSLLGILNHAFQDQTGDHFRGVPDPILFPQDGFPAQIRQPRGQTTRPDRFRIVQNTRLWRRILYQYQQSL